jgi:cell division protein FtsQ
VSRRTPSRNRNRQKQINILHTTTTKRHSQKQIVQMLGWCALVVAMVLAVGTGLHFGIAFALNRVLFTNPHYVLTKIQIEPRDHFSPRMIRQAAGLEPGQNLWTLNLRQIGHDIEKLPYVSSAKVERHFPDTVTILIHERVPVVKIIGLNVDLNTKETFYVDREGVVLKPREDDVTPLLPEIIGLTDAQAELEPGDKLDEASMKSALQIMDAIDHSRLHTYITIRTIDLSDPLYITMDTRQQMKIIFRHDYVDQQLQRLLQIVDDPRFQQRPISTVDLTPDCNVPVTFAQYQ